MTLNKDLAKDQTQKNNYTPNDLEAFWMPFTANQDFTLKNYLKYHITYKIFGSNETLDSFGKMPQEISQYIY